MVIIKIEFSNLINETLSPVAKSAGKTLNNLWALIFGKFDYYAQKKSIEREHSLKLFKEKIENTILEIPPENIQEPKLSIVGPALESSKYYYDEAELRSMFAHLIASSLDKSKNTIIRNSFTEIIKQLEPTDAQILKHINESSDSKKASIKLMIDLSENRGQIIKIRHHIANSSNFGGYKSVSSSIDNLIRLNLVEVPFGLSYNNKQNYAWVKDDIIYNELLNQYKKYEEYKVIYDEEIIAVTDFGKDFCEICLPNPNVITIYPKEH